MEVKSLKRTITIKTVFVCCTILLILWFLNEAGTFSDHVSSVSDYTCPDIKDEPSPNNEVKIPEPPFTS